MVAMMTVVATMFVCLEVVSFSLEPLAVIFIGFPVVHPGAVRDGTTGEGGAFWLVYVANSNASSIYSMEPHERDVKESFVVIHRAIVVAFECSKNAFSPSRSGSHLAGHPSSAPGRAVTLVGMALSMIMVVVVMIVVMIVVVTMIMIVMAPRTVDMIVVVIMVVVMVMVIMIMVAPSTVVFIIMVHSWTSLSGFSSWASVGDSEHFSHMGALVIGVAPPVNGKVVSMAMFPHEPGEVEMR